jgi:putative ATPase
VDLFERKAEQDRRGQPLAERMRPRDLGEFLGQRHLLGPGRMIERAIEHGEIPSLVLWGPPGSGKTTLARILAARVGAEFVRLSAVLAGVKDVREAVEGAGERLRLHGRRTVLFIDEIHRFNKAQQDALLPHVEAGTIVTRGATTENPSFEVISPLLSRTKVVRLERLSDEDLVVLLRRALADGERGFSDPADAGPEVLEAIAGQSDGDARRALNTLEVAHAIAPAVAGAKRIDLQVAREALQKRTLLYDRAGDEHYDVTSAFIKSLRGSDPDAAVYWMARMVEAGDDPIFLLRRMVIFAAEDVGLADPRALSVAVAALEAVRLVGLPEGVLPMTEAALYLALAPKSNTALTAYGAARDDVQRHGALPVPMHLRNAPTAMMKRMGWGEGYRYPHDFPEHHVREDYLPEELRGRRYYEPSSEGGEGELAERLRRLREKP